MDRPQVVSHDEWLAARKELLAQEKEATQVKDAVAARRRALPMVEVGKEYGLAGPGGPASLPDLFDGRRQLIVYHFMWLRDTDEGCPRCSVVADNIGDLSHLRACDTTLVLVSRAPLASIERFQQRMGWPVPWYSSLGSDFNYDFHVSLDEDIAPIEYNYKDKATLERDVPYIRSGADAHGLSVFLRDGDRVFHTYSTYGRGVDQLIGTYQYLDLTPLGRQRHVTGFSYHDKYEDAW
jgi:predicted dithiol-disulfide oxidoreductase (DUF899 family)